MPNFVYDLTSLPFPKTNARPLPVDLDRGINAAEWNQLCQAVIDLRSALLAGGLLRAPGQQLLSVVRAGGRATHNMPDSGSGTGGIHGAGAVGSAANLNNHKAWVRLRQPILSGQPRREFIFQRSDGSDATKWQILYSRGAGFTTGGAADTPPTASDQQTLVGNNGFETVFGAKDGTYIFHAVADTDRFWAAGYPIGGGIEIAGLFLDPMLSGTFDPYNAGPPAHGDNDPVVLYFGEPGDGGAADVLGVPELTSGPLSFAALWSPDGERAPACWMRSTLPGAAWIRVAACTLFHSPFENADEIISSELVGHGPTGAAFDQEKPASLQGGGGNFGGLVAGDTLGLSITDNNGNQQSFNVTFQTGDNSAGAASSRITSAVSGVAFVGVSTDSNNNSKLQITTITAGPKTIIQITGGSAVGKCGFSTGQIAVGKVDNLLPTILGSITDAIGRSMMAVSGQFNFIDILSRFALPKRVGITLRGLVGAIVSPRFAGTDAHNGLDRPQPIVYGTSLAARDRTGAAVGGIKGWSQLVQWATRPHENGDLITITAGSDVRIVIGDLVLPWKPDGTQPLR